MTERHPTDETRGLAALYALGALEDEDARAFEHHLESGCPACQTELDGFKRVVGSLGFSSDPIRPRAVLREELLARVRRDADTFLNGEPTQEDRSEPLMSGFIFRRAQEGTWREVLPGITVRVLFSDPVQARTTALVRMAAGARYTPHRHGGAEEVYVLEGNCVCGGQLLEVGDYHRAEAATIHTDTYSPAGCLMLTIFSEHNEPLS